MNSSSFHGFLIIDKPGGMTSRDVVDRAQRWFPRGTRLGHTGTLDPLATGVLVLAVGAGTRLTEHVQRMDKTYGARVRLGARSDTDDADGTVTPVPDATEPDRASIEQQLRAFLGAIEQVPPAYSAAKVMGRRAYALARRGEPVTLRPRTVHVYAIDVKRYEHPRIDLEVRCGKGTYIRSLARDLGERLGCGAYIEGLRRTRVGPFEASAGLGLDTDAATARLSLLPLTAGVTGLAHVTLAVRDAVRFRQGQSVTMPGFNLEAETELAVFDEVGKLIGVAMWEVEERRLRPEMVLAV